MYCILNKSPIPSRNSRRITYVTLFRTLDALEWFSEWLRTRTLVCLWFVHSKGFYESLLYIAYAIWIQNWKH